jgi:hypothetical protein
MADATLINHGMQVKGVKFLPDVMTHIIHLESSAGALFIDMDTKEFEHFMAQVVESYGEGVRHFINEMKKEMKK